MTRSNRPGTGRANRRRARQRLAG